MPASTQPSEDELVELQRTLYSSRNPTRRWLHHGRREWVLRAIAACLPTASDGASAALEVGPGSGIYLPPLLDAFDHVVASDIEPRYLRAIGLEAERLSLVVDDITNSALGTETYDLVLCTEVIEHIGDSQAALCEMHRVLRPGGTLLLTTPQRHSSMELACRVAFAPGMIYIARRVYREPVIETGHINLLSRQDAIEQLMGAGFRIHEEWLCGLYLPGIAELMGERAARAARHLERRWRTGRLSFLLWTQCYVARKGA